MKRVTIMLLCFILLFTSFAFAADVVTREYDIQTTNPDYSLYTAENIGYGDLADIPQTVENGFFSVKRVTDIKITLISEEKPKEMVYELLIEKELPEDADTLTADDGKVLVLQKTDWQESERDPIKGTYTMKGYDNKPTFPSERSFTAPLDNGTEITATAVLKDVKKTGASYSKDFSVTGKFIGDPDVSAYALGETLIPNNPASPEFAGYEEIILKYFGMDPDKYRITAGKWTSDYIEDDGYTVRYAKFTGKRLAGDWTGYYEEEITEDSPAKIIYTATCYYGEQKEALYNVHLAVEYGKTEVIVERVIATASASVFVIAAVIALILMKIKKKKENE